jgi:UDP-N-acetylglucosamine 2-epimerase (non-hydrolysing)
MTMPAPFKLAVIVGTRPEAIKLAPLILEARRQRQTFDLRIIRTSQHKEMVDQMMATFDLSADVDLDVMKKDQDLVHVMTASLRGLFDSYKAWRPDAVIVQGDTTTTLAGALAAFYHQIPVAHVEAGLRTGERYLPFPEEMNRVLVSRLAQWHFAPTQAARGHLLAEGIAPADIQVTGNTAIDALLLMVARLEADKRATAVETTARRRLLVTTHRRENQGAPMAEICQAVLDLLQRYDDLDCLFPVHPSPAVRAVVHPLLGGHPRIRLVEPLDYVDFVDAMRSAHLIFTDSGGIQEEAPTLGKPVLVLRDSTERPEAIEAGTARLVGSRRENVVAAACALLDDPVAYRAMAHAANPFGDGRASQRILHTLAQDLQASAQASSPSPSP